jgi:protein MpaA
MLKRVLPLLLLTPLLLVPSAAQAQAPGNHVLEVKRIGTSVKGRPIRAYRVGNPEAKVKAVVLGAIHGDEKAGIVLSRAILDGRRIRGVDLWVVPTINPDGVAANRRQNARGVDLNRNWSVRWAPLTGKYYSGTKPFSEPETRAFRDFIHEVNPRFIVSFHQPLYGVGRAGERPAFVSRLAEGLGLPRKAFQCSGVCHGTMTEWFNAHHRGTAVTVEFGAHPSRYYLRHRAMRGTVHAVLGRFR